MDETTKDAAQKVHNHREDGEEAVKRTSKVVPIDAGEGSESPEGNTNTPPDSKGGSRRPPKSTLRPER
jgi:hypothetical protein